MRSTHVHLLAAAAALALLATGLGWATTASGTEAAGATAQVARALPKQPARKKVKQPARKKQQQLRRKTPVRPAPAAPPAVVTSVLPNDPLWPESWSLAKVGAPSAWALTTGAAATVVAVLDTGVDRSHPDLQGAFVDGYDTVNEDADPADDHGHGTMVAGVIGARSNNGVGVVGACWNCSLMPVKVIGANGAGAAVDIAEGITWAVDHGARVLNLSFTMNGYDEGVARAIDHARARGVVVVAAAGNSGGEDETFPANLPGVLSVTATDPADGRYGWATYGRWVSVAAPGCSQSTASGGGYGDFCGTSSAAAFVSGLAGLARSYSDRPGDAIAAAFRTASVPVEGVAGNGRVRADALLQALAASSQTP